ncbi:IS6 family transposase [Chloroflexota bacterium]
MTQGKPKANLGKCRLIIKRVVSKAKLTEVTYTQTITITCKHCGSKNVVKYGTKAGYQYYLCHDCRRTFAGNNALPGMKYPPDQIASAVSLFYSGLSIDAIRRELNNIYHVYPSDSTVYDWVIRYTTKAVKKAKVMHIQVGSIWIADETYLKLDEGRNIWFWDIIDDRTRFLLASHISVSRSTKDAEVLMQKALEMTKKVPRIVYTDKLAAYLNSIELTFGADTIHKQGSPFDVGSSNNLIERFHGTLKARTKVMRGMHNKETAGLIMDGWLIHYNFFRPHEALGNRTPAEVAKADYPYKSWLDVVIGDTEK